MRSVLNNKIISIFVILTSINFIYSGNCCKKRGGCCKNKNTDNSIKNKSPKNPPKKLGSNPSNPVKIPDKKADTTNPVKITDKEVDTTNPVKITDKKVDTTKPISDKPVNVEEEKEEERGRRERRRKRKKRRRRKRKKD